MTVTVRAAPIRRGLVGLVGLLFLGHLAGQFSEHVLGRPSVKGLVPRLNMNAELSVPTWFASILLLLCAACLLLIAVDHRRAGSGDALGWGGLAAIFAYVALDEAVALHEVTIAPLRDLLGVERGWLFFAWVLPAAILVAVVLLLYRPFLRRLDPATRRALSRAALTFLVGALGVEAVGGWYLSTRDDDFLYEVIGGVEEVLELLGVILFLDALLRHLERTFGVVHLDLRPAGG